MQTKTFMCTRPRLAAELISKGYRCTRIPNPFDEGRKAWEVDLKLETALIIQEHYQKAGRSVPKIIMDTIEGEVISR